MAEQNPSVKDLDLPEKARNFIIQEWGIKNLHPPQVEAITPIMAGKNSLVAIPTASGKSLIAYIGIMRRLLVDEIGSKAIYIVPLKALATEKFDELTTLGNALNLTIGLGIGDASSEVKQIDECDILVCTSEKLDSLIRNKPQIMARVSIIISDEFHLLNDATRGPTLEVNLTKLRRLRPQSQIIALSATVGNCHDLSEWLGATLIQSDWRPVALEYSTFHDLHLEPRMIQSSAIMTEPELLNLPRELEGPKSHPSWVVLKDSMESEKQLLIFVGTRRSAESEAVKLSQRIIKQLSKENSEMLDKLNDIADSIEGRNQSSMGEKLANCVRGGVAFHHAGLTHSQRKIIEQSFKDGDLFCLTATPTLAAGVNLPASRVLVRDIKRWDDGMSRPISVMEVRQMLGRAGRPKYDDSGEAWVLCKGTDGWEIADQVSERYFFGKIEPIVSKLSSEPALRMHILSLIASGGLQHRGEIGDFFEATFLGYTLSSVELTERIDKILDWLIEERFIRNLGVDAEYCELRADREVSADENWDDETPVWASIAQEVEGVNFAEKNNDGNRFSRTAHDNPTLGFQKANDLGNVGAWHSNSVNQFLGTKYEATLIGKRVTQLYLDPLSASIIRTGLRRSVRRKVMKIGPVTNFGIIHLCCTTPDFSSLWAKNSEMEKNSQLWIKTNSVEDEILSDTFYDEMLLSTIKSAWLIELWTEEESFRSIEKKLDVNPGDLNYRVDLISWLLYSAKEILLADDVFSQEHMEVIGDLVSNINILRSRTIHGCKEDLLTLVNIPQVGRFRARELSKLGIRNPNDIQEMDRKMRSKILNLRGWGPTLLAKIETEVDKVLKRNKSKTKVQRLDDVPLENERDSTLQK